MEVLGKVCGECMVTSLARPLLDALAGPGLSRPGANPARVSDKPWEQKAPSSPCLAPAMNYSTLAVASASVVALAVASAIVVALAAASAIVVALAVASALVVALAVANALAVALAVANTLVVVLANALVNRCKAG